MNQAGRGSPFARIAFAVYAFLTVYASLYPPKRFTPAKSGKNFLKENLNTAGYYIRDYTKGAEAEDVADLAIGEGKLIEVRGLGEGEIRARFARSANVGS